MAPTSDIVRIGAVRLRAVRFRDEQSKVPVPFDGPVLDLVGAQHATRVEKNAAPAFSPVEYRAGASRAKRGILHATALVRSSGSCSRGRCWRWATYASGASTSGWSPRAIETCASGSPRARSGKTSTSGSRSSRSPSQRCVSAGGT